MDYESEDMPPKTSLTLSESSAKSWNLICQMGMGVMRSTLNVSQGYYGI